METAGTKNKKAPQKAFGIHSAKRVIGALVLGSALMLLNTACPSNSGGGAPAPIPVPVVATGAGGYGVPTCSGCPANEAFLTNGIADASSGGAIAAELNVFFYGDASILSQTQVSGSYSQPYYGAVAAAGRFYLAQPLPQCNVTAGTYTFTTVSPGVFGANGVGTSFDNIILNVNGTPIQLQISGDLQAQTPASTGQDGQTYPYRLVMTTFIVKRTDTYAYCNLSLELN